MKQRGKQSANNRVAPVSLEKRRPAPPTSLNADMATLWMRVVGCFEPGYFRPADHPLLESYVRHCHRAGILDAEIDLFEAEWLRDSEGLKRYKHLLDARGKETSLALSLARSLRIAQQSRVHRHSAAAAVEKADTVREDGRKPWEFE